MTEPVPMSEPVFIEVWVCPRCASWYGSSTAGDLSTLVNRRSSLRNLADEEPSAWGQITGHRSQCRICKSNDGVDVDRVLVKFVRKDQVVALATQAIEVCVEKLGGGEARDAGQIPYRAPTPK